MDKIHENFALFGQNVLKPAKINYYMLQSHIKIKTPDLNWIKRAIQPPPPLFIIVLKAPLGIEIFVVSNPLWLKF